MKAIRSNAAPQGMQPILPAWRHKGGWGSELASGWCQRCKRWHTHGATDGARAPHCADSSAPAYFLTIIGEAPPELIAALENSPHQPPEAFGLSDAVPCPH